MKLFSMVAVFVFAFMLSYSAVSEEPAAKYSEADYKVAYELLEAMNTKQTLENTISQMLDMQVKSNPQLEKVKGVMMAFFQKYMSFDALKKPYADLYLEFFTPEELKELTKFYLSPLGKKVALTTPTLTVKGAQLGQQMVMSHIGELQENLKQELEKQAK